MESERMAWVERDLKEHLVSTHCHRQGCQPPDQATSSSGFKPERDFVFSCPVSHFSYVLSSPRKLRALSERYQRVKEES